MKITREMVLAAHGKKPKRIHFATKHKDALKVETKNPARVGRFYVPFGKGFSKLFIGKLRENTLSKYHKDSCWMSISTEEAYRRIETWIEDKKNIVFLRDCLTTSIAIDLNISESGSYTEMGRLEHDAKQDQSQKAIDTLISRVVETIKKFSLYEKADTVCAVPCHEGKVFDLPSEIVRRVSHELHKNDLTGNFKFQFAKSSIKEKSFAEKWDEWEEAGLIFSKNITGKTVILIDDKYQSGITIQYVASKLCEAGAIEVYGLCLVKTLRDDDNQQEGRADA